MKSIEIFGICICLMLAGGILFSAVDSQFKDTIYLFGALGGIVGGGCAALALFIWKKQIYYNRKLEVIEVALKVQFLANSYVRKVVKIDDFCRYAVDPSITEIKHHIGMFNEAQAKDTNHFDLALNELKGKAAMYQRLTNDRKISELSNEIIAAAIQVKRYRIPYDIDTTEEIRNRAFKLQELVDIVTKFRSKFETHIEKNNY
ncbi:hypothetical protein MHM89_15290 [Pseudoalteromonas sp. CNC9-20]|uniref:hypothetical protein n=1 Tax=Pseudoalteromonas sp. CNC9-20 TaxID=2917750 RepID=UPI001EF6947B|nr:hypothetical protein [Pseudoalteromonas sp. CNC9-20]MCG7571264.1 hypothetical protein [Pseudoalteromonas sp. CNC9-20]